MIRWKFPPFPGLPLFFLCCISFIRTLTQAPHTRLPHHTPGFHTTHTTHTPHVHTVVRFPLPPFLSVSVSLPHFKSTINQTIASSQHQMRILHWTWITTVVLLSSTMTTATATATARATTASTLPPPLPPLPPPPRTTTDDDRTIGGQLERVDMPSPGAASVALMESLFSTLVVPPTVPFTEKAMYPSAAAANMDKMSASSASTSSASTSSLSSAKTANAQPVYLHRRAPASAPPPPPLQPATAGSAVCGECDPADPVHGGCCTSDCKRMPDYRTACTIQGYAGSCRSGQCVSRYQQCSRYDTKTLLVGESALRGPFLPCSPSANNTQDNVESRCTLACQGRAASSGIPPQQLCLDFQDYANVERFVVNGALCGNSAAASTLGLCWDGTCVNEACRRFRCTNHGECVRSRAPGPAGGAGGSECRCDSGFAGEACNKMDGCGTFLLRGWLRARARGKSVSFPSFCCLPTLILSLSFLTLSSSVDDLVDVCGVCNGDGSSCPQTAIGQATTFFGSGTFKLIVLPVGLTLLVTVIALATLLMVRRKKQANGNGAGGGGIGGLDALGLGGAGGAGGGVLSSSFFKSKIPHKLGMSVSWDEYRCVHTYEQTMPDELELREGDILFKLFEYDDGWAKGYNTRTQEEGIYPVSFTEKVTPGIAHGGGQNAATVSSSSALSGSSATSSGAAANPAISSADGAVQGLGMGASGGGRRMSTPSMIASLGLRSDSNNADHHAARSHFARFSLKKNTNRTEVY